MGLVRCDVLVAATGRPMTLPPAEATEGGGMYWSHSCCGLLDVEAVVRVAFHRGWSIAGEIQLLQLSRVQPSTCRQYTSGLCTGRHVAVAD